MSAAFAEAATRVGALPSATAAGAGTTLTGAVITEHGGLPYWLMINIGDSRTYRLSAGELEQISVDHSWVQELVDQGSLTEHEAQGDPRRNVITRAIGAGIDMQPDYRMIPLVAGDRILLCSDGLSGEVPVDVIAAILLTEHDPQSAATRLVHEALLRGGRDNVTTVVVDVLGGGDGHNDATVPSAMDATGGLDDTIPLAPVAVPPARAEEER